MFENHVMTTQGVAMMNSLTLTQEPESHASPSLFATDNRDSGRTLACSMALHDAIFNLFDYVRLPSLKLSTWKWMVGIRSFAFGARPIFRCELLVSGSVLELLFHRHYIKPRKVDGNYWTHPCWATASEKTNSSGFQYMTESKFNLTLLSSNKTRFRSFCLLNQDFFGSRIGPPLSCN